MQGYSSSFPRGGAGAGLLLLRLAVAMQLLFMQGAGGAAPWWQLALLGLLALLLALGMLTPVCGALCAMLHLLCLTMAGTGPAAPGVVAPAIAAVTAGALVLMGPGAYALDARLFGRRRLILPAAATERDRT